jgi:hypothetical protein
MGTDNHRFAKQPFAINQTELITFSQPQNPDTMF